MRTALALAVAGSLTFSASALAKTSCIDSAEALAQALSALSNSTTDSEADDIRIRPGHYSARAGGWVGSVTNHHALTIRGGFTNANCTQRTHDAVQTILDGNNAVGVLTLNTPLLPNSAIEVSDLT